MPQPPAPSSVRHSLGSVSFLNAVPLIEPLVACPDIAIVYDVPARLLPLLESRAVEVAMLPVIDLQRLDDAVLVPAGGIGCDGPTLTVRIFSRVPFDRIGVLACDGDSHTSVVLAAIILAEAYACRPQRVELAKADQYDAVLLIGDKVITDEPTGYPHQLDLGEAWKRLTGLPFVFAAWATRAGVDLRDLPARLRLAHQQSLARIDDIVQRHAPRHRWPLPIARRYLAEYLRYTIGERELQAIDLYHRKAHQHGAMPTLRSIPTYPVG